MDIIDYDVNGNIILAGCPFCDCIADFQNEWHPTEFEVIGRYVQCTNCHIRTKTLPITLSCNKEQVDLLLAKQWNRRAK